LGANGAGKTTSIKILLKFIKADTGEIEFAESMLSGAQGLLGNIGVVPERPYFYPDLTGSEFCHFMGGLNSLNHKYVDQQMSHWARLLAIDHALSRKVRTYSKGMLQRLGFVAALLHGPKLLILDEPMSGLDPIGRKEFKDVMLALNLEGKSIFFSSHIVQDIEEICSQLIVLKEGKLFYEGKTADLIDQSAGNQVEAIVKQAAEGKVGDMAPVSYDSSRGVARYLFPAEKKNNFLAQMNRQEDQSLERLVPLRPKLEEIIYAAKGADYE
jgi:ABC-2 type transport system ATP-binding protein